MHKTRILTINGGSSSIKFAVFEFGESFQRIQEGVIEVKASNYTAAKKILIDRVEDYCKHDTLIALGHRVVHGGPKYILPQKIDKKMIEELKRLDSFDPEHLPGEVMLIEAFQNKFPDLPQVACFDTAFHKDLPRVARQLAIPRRYEAKGIHRYGFHGLSYQFLVEELGRLAGIEAAKERIIFAHLGNGASLAAVHNGKSIDTSMSFTPTAGVPMSTRSGDIDPGLVGYIARLEGINAKQFNEMMNFQSGLLGISETSSDMRELLNCEAQDVRAAEAVAVFCYQVKKWIGAFAAALGGLDTLVFSGGIGENAYIVRSRICEGLEFLGVRVDEDKNIVNAPVISVPSNRVEVRVIHTDEELMIAKNVCHVLGIKVV